MESLKIKRIVEETSDTKTFYFDTSASTANWNFAAGQYITLEVSVNDELLRRSYSMSSAPFEKEVGVTIKRVKDGRVSGFMNDSVIEGQTISVGKPEGKFKLLPDPASRNDYYFIAAGSGITPIMAMIKTILEEEPMSSCYLLYGNRAENSIIFQAALQTLQAEYKDQLYVSHTLSSPEQVKKSGLSGLLGGKTTSWKGLKGRIDTAKIREFLDSYPGKSKNKRFYVCGPGNMIDLAEQSIKGAGFEKEQIHREYFSSPDDVKPAAVVGTPKDGITLKVKLEGETIELIHNNDQTILETLLNAGKNPPYSCTSGACSTCVAKVITGDISMDSCFALDDDEIAQGYVLTCQSRINSATADIDYEE